jgi:hypothetical protein
MTVSCRHVADVVDEIASGLPASHDIDAHLLTCRACQARLHLARRIEQALLTWPTTPPPPQFSMTVAAAARRETWRQEVVVDWGFNFAVGASVFVILAGGAALLWMAGAVVRVEITSDVAAGIVRRWLGDLRGHMTVVGTATLLLATTVGTWWWAEERARW